MIDHISAKSVSSFKNMDAALEEDHLATNLNSVMLEDLADKSDSHDRKEDKFNDDDLVVRSVGYEKTVLQALNLNVPIAENSEKGGGGGGGRRRVGKGLASMDSSVEAVGVVGASPLESKMDFPSSATAGRESGDAGETKPKDSGCKEDCTETKENPIAAALHLQPVVKKFKLFNNENLACYSPIVVNTCTLTESKNPAVSYWVSQDYDLFFSSGGRKFAREIEVAKSLRFGEEVPDLTEESVIYISTRIVNPGRVMSQYFNSGPKARDLYIDLILNNSGCSILLQMMKFFKEKEALIESNIASVHVRMSATYVNQIRVIFEVLTQSTEFYKKIKSLGLFVGLHQYANGYVFDALTDTPILLPPELEKLLVANGLEICDFAYLPTSLRDMAFHNVKTMNLSKFNLNKDLKYLCIDGEEVKLEGRVESYPKKFRDLEVVKFDNSVAISSTFHRFRNLTSLSLSNLSFARTKELTLPHQLRKLELISCSLSSNMQAFPDSLKALTIMKSKWSPKNNCRLGRLQRLKIADCEVKDLKDKIAACKCLLQLEVSKTEISNISRNFVFPPTLKILMLTDVCLKGLSEQAFPRQLEVLSLVNNDIASVPLLPKLETLLISGNPLKKDVDLSGIPIKSVTLQHCSGLETGVLHNQTHALNVAGTLLSQVTGSGLTKLILDGCKQIDLKSLAQQCRITQLSLKDCDMSEFGHDCHFFSDLKILDISHNKLKRVDLSKFENLLDVDLSSNHLTEVESSQLPSCLKSINAKQNEIKEVKIADMPCLEWLQISDNRINDVSQIKVPDKLNTLIANNNFFGTVVTSNFVIPSGLRHLELNKCKIAEFDAVLPSKLMSCCLSGNKLHSQSFKIEFAEKPANLKFLDLSSNYFKSFDFGMLQGAGIELAELNLASNMIEEVPQIPSNILSAILFKA
ncbi:uncharacterized protein LODBEIA_P38070 [Lodderomyces beijingensis]|uniref:Uncharacterized protein n=1 Tax=Lodderomyces beijingensis TaxID=1775926 RepID=A0ABP0ZN58_9ASCO